MKGYFDQVVTMRGVGCAVKKVRDRVKVGSYRDRVGLSRVRGRGLTCIRSTVQILVLGCCLSPLLLHVFDKARQLTWSLGKSEYARHINTVVRITRWLHLGSVNLNTRYHEALAWLQKFFSATQRMHFVPVTIQLSEQRRNSSGDLRF
jgi:hypothetical protein